MNKESNQKCVRCGQPASFTIVNPATTLYYCDKCYFKEPSVNQPPPNPRNQRKKVSDD